MLKYIPRFFGIGGVGVLIDIGGSGVKIRRYAHGHINSHLRSSKPSSREEFYDCIKQVSKSKPQGIGVMPFTLSRIEPRPP